MANSDYGWKTTKLTNVKSFANRCHSAPAAISFFVTNSNNLHCVTSHQYHHWFPMKHHPKWMASATSSMNLTEAVGEELANQKLSI